MDGGSIEIRESEFGKGLFAKKDLEEGSVICRITGKQLNFTQTLLLKEKESHCIQVDLDKYILCEPPFLYSNHSCNPNSAINEHLELFALKNINAGEEIFWDYSTSMLERHWTMKCHCGENNCRGIITDFDLLPAAVQSNYLRMNIALPFIVHFINYRRARTA